MSYLPARSDLDVDAGLSVPEDGDFFLWEMNHSEVPGWPDEHPLLPVNHTRWILQKMGRTFYWNVLEYYSRVDLNIIIQQKWQWLSLLLKGETIKPVAHILYFRIDASFHVKNILEVTLTGFPESSSNTTTDLPMLISRDFLQMTPLSKQSTFSAVTLSITSALLCGREET